MGIAWRKTRALRLAWAPVAAFVVGLLLASCSASSTSTAPGKSAPAGQSGAAFHERSVISLNAISTLRSLFNRADGHTRLVLILSPT